jgi:arylamine N-acetyltransferase
VTAPALSTLQTSTRDELVRWAGTLAPRQPEEDALSDAPPGPDLFARYLRLLGLAPRTPSLDALAELTRAHLTHVPFENVSKFLHRGPAPPQRPPDLERFLDGIERHHFGGTCYSNAFNFHLLLGHLGYDVALCGADMSAPDVHMVNIVRLNGRPYLLDVGYAAPFLEPLPLDLAEDQEIAWGRERYVLKPRDAEGRPRMELYRDGGLRHRYTVNPSPRRIEDFAQVIADSFSDSATFMRALLIARFRLTRSVTLRNLTLIEAEPHGYRLTEIPGREHLPEAIEAHFGIPRAIARTALAGVELTRQA